MNFNLYFKAEPGAAASHSKNFKPSDRLCPKTIDLVKVASSQKKKGEKTIFKNKIIS